MVRMTEKSGKDNVVALRGRGRPRTKLYDTQKQVSPASRKGIIPLEAYKAIASILSYDPLTGVFRWLEHDLVSHRPPGRVAGSKNKAGYVYITFGKWRFTAQRLAWFISYGEVPDYMVDHINRCRDDNRLENLRLANCSQNQANRVFKSKHKRGVKRAGSRFCALIRVGGVPKYLGMYDTEDQAHEAYVRASKEAFGEYAVVTHVPR